MTPREQQWEDYIEIMERLRDRAPEVIEGFRVTLREIRELPTWGGER